MKEIHTTFDTILSEKAIEALISSQDEDLGAVENGLESVRDGEDGALCEGGPDGRLDEVVRLQVHRGGRLVQHQDLGLSCGEERSQCEPEMRLIRSFDKSTSTSSDDREIVIHCRACAASSAQ